MSQPRVTQKTDSISMSYQTIDWFEQIIKQESLLADEKLALDLSELQIKTDDKNLFTINGTQYQKIHIILGYEGIYWIFYNSKSLESMDLQRIEGSGVLPVSYCRCCLNDQYVNILNVIQKYIDSTNHF